MFFFSLYSSFSCNDISFPPFFSSILYIFACLKVYFILTPLILEVLKFPENNIYLCLYFFFSYFVMKYCICFKYLQFINLFFVCVDAIKSMHLIAFCVVAFVYFTFPFISTFFVFSQSVSQSCCSSYVQ